MSEIPMAQKVTTAGVVLDAGAALMKSQIQRHLRGLGGGPSSPRQLLRGHEPCVPQGSEGHPAAGPDGEPGDAAVVQAHPQPPLRGELQRPARKIKITGF